MSPRELPKAYEAAQYEDEIYDRAESAGFFKPEAGRNTSGKTFSLVMPPPNATGVLHIGHAVMLALEDIMVRYHRMKGDKTLWIPGTDHAAIATQAKVERLLWDEEKKTRHDLGREKFLARVDAFVADSQNTIRKQVRKMGASCDWSRECFTLDAPRSRAVRVAFKKMYDDGLIYRGPRIVNWDPKLQTTVSDDEVEWLEEVAPFYYFKYGPFVIGTARPETKFGDKYVVMHLDDARYKQYEHGQKLTVEWINGPIIATIIKDAAVDMSFGTGVMTITPWHDATDFDIAERHGLDKEQIIDFDGNLLPVAGEFADAPIAAARAKIVEKLRVKGLVERVEENYVHRVAVNSRGGGLIEPQIKEQWFVNVHKPVAARGGKTLKELMRDAVAAGGIKIIPERFNKIYFYWIDNLRDWNISRQIWYGHRVPVWYCVGEGACKLECKEPIVAVEPPKHCPHCGTTNIKQDSDTLDTWFSSGLWTFSTLGWPEDTPGLAAYHPTSVLETGHDIIFFWIARMILMSACLLGEVPFRTVYLHGIVRDEQGRKMSKSLGNVIDSLDVIAKYGTDAVRLSLVIGATPGNDTRLSEEKIAGFRNFTNKLWNIGRFIIQSTISVEERRSGRPPFEFTKKKGVHAARHKDFSVADQWIMERLNEVIREVTKAIDAFEFSRAGEALRDFTWGEFADWYLEIAKIEKNKEAILAHVLEALLKLWHPFMPFVTEVLWQEAFARDERDMLMLQAWPEAPRRGIFAFLRPRSHAKAQIQILMDVVSALRTLRAENKIEPAKKIAVVIAGHKHAKFLQSQAEVIKTLGRIETLEIASTAVRPPKAVAAVVAGVEIFVPLAGLVDVAAERSRLERELAETQTYIQSIETRLGNGDFVKRAPRDVVEKEKDKLAAAREKAEKMWGHINSLA